MGAFFSNIHIKKNETLQTDDVIQAMIKMMQEKGYLPISCKEDADGEMIVYSEPDSKWISVCSDLIDFNSADDSKEMASPLSKELNTDILTIACFDSDYLFLNLINEASHTNAWANVGQFYVENLFPKTNFASWSDKVKNIFSFSACINESYVFAEEVLDDMEELLDLPRIQSDLSLKYISESIDRSNLVKLYFATPKNNVKSELPELEILSFSLIPCIPEEDSKICAYNNGGASRGLEIAIWGDYVEHEEITFSDVFLEYVEKDDWKIIPITLSKIQAVNGSWMYYWKDTNFSLSPKPNPKLSEIKRMNVEYDRSFGIRFTPHGNNRKFLDIKVSFIPTMNRKKGQCCWCVWHEFDSKFSFIQAHNQSAIQHEFQGTFPKDRLGKINKNDYDL